MKISKEKSATAFAEPEDKVPYLAEIPGDLHRFIKSEASLLGKRINDVVVEALAMWRAAHLARGGK